MNRRLAVLLGAGLVVLVASAAGWWWLFRRPRSDPPLTGAAVVWAIDDGARIHAGQGATPLLRGEENPVWKPDEPLSLFGLRGETLAFQVVVSAGSDALADVEVALERLGPWATAERFVVHELAMKRRSGGKNPRESLGWSADAQPPAPPTSSLPDALVPIALAPAWADYPMSVPTQTHRVVWFDLELAADAPAGSHRAEVAVRAEGSAIATLPVELEVGAATLPYRPLGTMLFFEPEDVEERVGSKAAVAQHQQLVHAHHVDTVFPLRSAEEVRAHADALTGALYTEEHGYRGPGRGVGASLVVLGMYGSLGDPSEDKLAVAGAMLDELAAHGIVDDPGKRDVVLYTIDETCDSPRSPAWRKALDASPSERLRRLRIAHTCSEPPAGQPVDVPIVHSALYRPETAARASGKHVWVYNGALPQTGAFLTDSWPISLRANPWIQFHHGIERWFYWESTFWNDDNRGGHGPYDPLATAETFHNDDGDHCNGDGVLVYPGKQTRPGYRSLGFDGVVPSMRLKQWRRGLQDAGYLVLARAIDPERTRALTQELAGNAFEADGDPRWPTSSEPYLRARRALFDLIVAQKRTTP